MENDDLIVMMEAGYVYLGMQKFKEAKEVFEGASVLAPESEVPFVAVGSVFFAQEKFDQAISWYRKALKKNPESPFAKSYYGEALFFKGRNKEALEALHEAIELDPDGQSGNFAHTLVQAISDGFTPPGKPDKPEKKGSQKK
jgi:tetratricopeptide (TPR) repeat protein